MAPPRKIQLFFNFIIYNSYIFYSFLNEHNFIKEDTQIKWIKIIGMCLVSYGALAVVGALAGETVGRKIADMWVHD